VVVAARRQKRPARTERDAQHLRTWSRLLNKLLWFRIERQRLGVPAPEANSTIVAGRRQPALRVTAVRRELNRGYHVAVTLQDTCALGGAQAPHADALVAAA